MSMATTAKAPKGYEAYSTLNPQQSQLMQLITQIITGQGGAMGGPLAMLQKMFSNDPEAMKDFEAPYKRQFEEQTIPDIAERFSGQGAQRSSAFGQALSSAGAGLQENLAYLKAGRQDQSMQQLFQMIQGLLGTQTTGVVEKQKPWWQQALTGLVGGVGSGVGQGAGAYATKKIIG